MNPIRNVLTGTVLTERGMERQISVYCRLIGEGKRVGAAFYYSLTHQQRNRLIASGREQDLFYSGDKDYVFSILDSITL